jgi:hypothetical protein
MAKPCMDIHMQTPASGYEFRNVNFGQGKVECVFALGMYYSFTYRLVLWRVWLADWTGGASVARSMPCRQIGMNERHTVMSVGLRNKFGGPQQASLYEMNI